MIPVDALDLATLPSVAHTALHDAPDLSAVYFVLDADGHVLYIGATISLWQRWNASQHHQHNNLVTHAFWALAWLSVPSKDLGEVEAQAIAHFRPLYNGKKIPDPRYCNLKITAKSLRLVRLIAVHRNEKQYAVLERLLEAEWSRLNITTTEETVEIPGLPGTKETSA